MKEPAVIKIYIPKNKFKLYNSTDLCGKVLHQDDSLTYYICQPDKNHLYSKIGNINKNEDEYLQLNYNDTQFSTDSLTLTYIIEYESLDDNYVQIFLDIKASEKQSLSYSNQGWIQTIHHLLRFKNYKNQFLLYFLNIILGYYLYNVINELNYNFEESPQILTKDIASYLQDIIFWLKGNPSGLKLVKPLTYSLGQFFIFHIQLWTDYMNLVAPLIFKYYFLLKLLPLLGITIFFNVLIDITKVLMLHIFCIYVYISKLYHVILTALISLLRLFCGYKKNPLRNRIDHMVYELDQMFVGTLFFTILLFILPSIWVYYVVFATLRLTFVLLSFTVSVLTTSFIEFPVLDILSRFFKLKRSQRGEIYFDFVNQHDNHLYLDFKVSQLRYSQILLEYWKRALKSSQPIDHFNWKSLPLSLLNGNLI